jgi:hypothetical protein
VASLDAKAVEPAIECAPVEHSKAASVVAEDGQEGTTPPESTPPTEDGSETGSAAISGEMDRLSALLDDAVPEEENADKVQSDNNQSLAIWSGSKSLDELLAGYLDRGERALAWKLAELAEEVGFYSPVPVILLKALAAGPAIVGPYDQSTQIMGEFLAAGMSALDVADELGSESDLHARSLALAVLLRPALICNPASPNSPIWLASKSNATFLRSCRISGNGCPERGRLRACTPHRTLFFISFCHRKAGLEGCSRLPRTTICSCWKPNWSF